MNPSTWRVTWLIAGLAWRRLGNRFARLRRQATKAGERAATARKRAPGKLLLGFMALLFAFQVVSTTTRLVDHAARAAERDDAPELVFVSDDTLATLREVVQKGACSESEPALRLAVVRAFQDEARWMLPREGRQARERLLVREFDARCDARFRASSVVSTFWPDEGLWYSGRHPLGALKGLALTAALLALALSLQTIAGTGNDLTSVDVRLEFLFAFPVRARALFLARIFALSLTSPTLWVIGLPFYAVIFYCAGLGVLALILGAVVTLYIGLLAGASRVLVEATLPRLLSPKAVARCQAALLVASYLSMVLAIGYSLRASQTGALLTWIRLPDAVLYAPATAPLLLAAAGAHAAAGGLVALLSVTLVVTLAVLVAERSVRGGFVVSSSADQVTRGSRGESSTDRFGWLHGGSAKELKALFRDRQLRMQAFVTPVMLVGMQIWLNPSLLSSVGSSPRALVVAAFATSMFTLATGACSLLATEGNALWLLYTVPVSLERVLAAKLRVWIAVAMFFAVAVLVGVWWQKPELVGPTLPYVPLLLVGIVIYAVIALGIGALGTDPLEAEPRRRVRPGAVYLFMLLAGLFGYALSTPSLWAKLVQLVLSLLLAYALWQRLQNELPYLLDPTEAPPPALVVADGVVAAMGFFVVQTLLLLLFQALDWPLAKAVTFAFFGAGLTVSLLTVAFYFHTRLPRWADALGLRRPRQPEVALAAVGTGALAGLGAAALALAYLRLVVPNVSFLRKASERAPDLLTGDDVSSRFWLVVLTVVAAPLFEEFIFRGVLFAGFRRSFGTPLAAFASALVFALVHPPVAAPVVFLMALGAAFVYERWRWLGAPIATHCVYNGIVVLAALR